MLGVSQIVIFDDQGGEGVQTPPKKHDIINEQPLTNKTQMCGYASAHRPSNSR